MHTQLVTMMKKKMRNRNPTQN